MIESEFASLLLAAQKRAKQASLEKDIASYIANISDLETLKNLIDDLQARKCELIQQKWRSKCSVSEELSKFSQLVEETEFVENTTIKCLDADFEFEDDDYEIRFSSSTAEPYSRVEILHYSDEGIIDWFLKGSPEHYKFTSSEYEPPKEINPEILAYAFFLWRVYINEYPLKTVDNNGGINYDGLKELSTDSSDENNSTDIPGKIPHAGFI